MLKQRLLFFSLLSLSSLWANDTPQGNAPLNPKTCTGDKVVIAGVLYWNANQEGLEYAIQTQTTVPVLNPTLDEIEELNNLRDAQYLAPHPHQSYGYRLGLGYQYPCDGWDIGVTWTHFHTSSFTEIETNIDTTFLLIPLWSAFAPAQGSVLFARGIKSSWKLKLNVIDFQLGREFWTSKTLSLRSFIGLRYANINQALDLRQRGGSWSPRMSPEQMPFNNLIELDNDYKGVGPLAGLDTTWRLGCGWGLFSNWASSILYGRFNLSNHEENQLIISPYDKIKILQTKSRFRASRAVLDWMLGIEWSSIFNNRSYAVTGRLGWEHHLYFHQNELHRVNRSGDTAMVLPNNTGENLYDQRRGNLGTQGLTFTLKIEF